VEFLLLSGFAFLAGVIDSIVGGGGLLQLSARLVMLAALIGRLSWLTGIWLTGISQ